MSHVHSHVQHFKLNKKEHPWWQKRNKTNHIPAGSSSTSIIANMQQTTGCSKSASAIQSQFCDREEEIGRSGGSTSDIGVQCSDIMSADGLQKNTGRLQTRIHQIKQTMIDHYSTMVWCEHRGHPKLAVVYIDAYVILMDHLFSHDEASRVDEAVNIRQETRVQFQKNILQHREKEKYSSRTLPAECILAYQDIIHNLLAVRDIVAHKSLTRNNLTAVMVTADKHHNKIPAPAHDNASTTSYTVSVFIIIITIYGLYLLLNL